MNKLFTWSYGRQNTGYRILPLFLSKRLKADCYLIHYPKRSFIPPHKDPAPTGCVHRRINIVLPWPHEGGFFLVEGKKATPEYSFLGFEVYVFDSSEKTHQVTVVTKGARWVLSMGRLLCD